MENKPLRLSFWLCYGILIGCLFVLAFLQAGCIAVSLTERHYLKRTDQVMRSHIPREVLAECGYNFNFEAEVSRVEELPGKMTGKYNPFTEIIFYEAGDYKALAHERVHALNWSSRFDKRPVSWLCLDQALAYMVAAMIIEQEGHARVLQRSKEKERAARARRR